MSARSPSLCDCGLLKTEKQHSDRCSLWGTMQAFANDSICSECYREHGCHCETLIRIHRKYEEHHRKVRSRLCLRCGWPGTTPSGRCSEHFVAEDYPMGAVLEIDGKPHIKTFRGGWQPISAMPAQPKPTRRDARLAADPAVLCSKCHARPVFSDGTCAECQLRDVQARLAKLEGKT